MNITEREEDFKESINARLKTEKHISPCYGTSNIARMIPGGIVLAVSNLDNFGNEIETLALLSRICPLPNAELYIGAIVESGINELRHRLQEMLKMAGEGDDRFGNRNNNTSLCLGLNCQLFVYNKKISELNQPPQDYLYTPIPLDKLYYAIYCPQATPKEREMLRLLLENIRQFVGSEKMEELPVWAEFKLLTALGSVSGYHLDNILKEFRSSVKEANINCAMDIPGRISAALLAKPLLILTGLSGSGKSKVANLLAAWLSDQNQQSNHRSIFIPVGSDWTNREPLLGYPDALTPGEYRLPATGALQLILRAIQNPSHPYFLILDEMNLSHVERYFADMLSAMESGETISLHEDKSYPGSDWSGVPPEIKLPPNLFVIGTVNVDETTYMFSPKVLDRANVIEFTVSKNEISTFLENPLAVDLDKIAGKGAAFAETFVAAATQKDISLEELGEKEGRPVKLIIKEALETLFDAFSEVNAEFGYRPAKEISRFIYYYAKVSGEEWKVDDALDAAIIQKLLPKLHGSKTKLGPALEKLNKLCEGKYPLSFAKIKRMEMRLKQNGFTSFAEA